MEEKQYVHARMQRTPEPGTTKATVEGMEKSRSNDSHNRQGLLPGGKRLKAAGLAGQNLRRAPGLAPVLRLHVWELAPSGCSRISLPYGGVNHYGSGHGNQREIASPHHVSMAKIVFSLASNGRIDCCLQLEQDRRRCRLSTV
jgi:hypothetical protein